MKKYTTIFLAILLSMGTYAMDDLESCSGEIALHLRPLSSHHTSSHDARILDDLDKTIKHLYTISERCINCLAECGAKLDYLKGFDSVGEIGQYVIYLDEYISSEKAYINRLRHPDPTMGSTAHDAAKLTPLLENMIKNAEEKKALAIANTPRKKIENLETAHKEIIIKLKNLLLENNNLKKIFVEGSTLHYPDDFNVKIQSTLQCIHRHLESNSSTYHVLDMYSKGDYFCNIKTLLSEITACLCSVSKEIHSAPRKVCKMYNPLDLSYRIAFANESKRDS